MFDFMGAGDVLDRIEFRFHFHKSAGPAAGDTEA